MTVIVKRVLSVTGSSVLTGNSVRKAIVIMERFAQKMKAGVYSYFV